VSELAFGIHAVEALLDSAPETIELLSVLEGRNDHKVAQLLRRAQKKDIRVRYLSKQRLNEMAKEGNHQGVIATYRAKQAQGENHLFDMLDRLQEPPFLLILDGVTDPHNLGACIRTADAAGVHGVITTKDKAVGLNATVRKVACGAAEHVPFFIVTNLKRLISDLQQRGIWIVGTAGEAETCVFDADLRGPIAVVMGAEGKGLRRLTREACDLLVKLPMADGAVSSLNVSVATGVTLFEAVRQR
jgi:23S rRNA (guanosine2251-2'-O)-methyltransferase